MRVLVCDANVLVEDDETELTESDTLPNIVTRLLKPLTGKKVCWEMQAQREIQRYRDTEIQRETNSHAHTHAHMPCWLFGCRQIVGPSSFRSAASFPFVNCTHKVRNSEGSRQVMQGLVCTDFHVYVCASDDRLVVAFAGRPTVASSTHSTKDFCSCTSPSCTFPTQRCDNRQAREKRGKERLCLCVCDCVYVCVCVRAFDCAVMCLVIT